AYHGVLLLDDLLRLRLHGAELPTRGGNGACRRANPRSHDPTRTDCVTQRDVSAKAGVTQVTNRRDAGLEVLEPHLRTEQRALRGAHRGDGEDHVRVITAKLPAIVLQ